MQGFGMQINPPRGALPTYEQLRYAQTLLVTAALVLLALYLGARTLEHGPNRLIAAARKRTGV